MHAKKEEQKKNVNALLDGHTSCDTWQPDNIQNAWTLLTNGAKPPVAASEQVSRSCSMHFENLMTRVQLGKKIETLPKQFRPHKSTKNR